MVSSSNYSDGRGLEANLLTWPGCYEAVTLTCIVVRMPQLTTGKLEAATSLGCAMFPD